MSHVPSKEPARIRAMFGAISARYDFMNALMSFGRHRAWKRAAAREAARDAGREGAVLDACTGTGDIAIELGRLGSRVVGTDFSPEMLAIAKKKLPPGSAVSLGRADTLRLPFRDGAFRAVTVGWGVRNVADLEAALRELARVLAPGGRLHILESGIPPNPFVRFFYNIHFLCVVPLLGWIFAGPGRAAYSYLPASVLAFPPPEEFASLMKRSGFDIVLVRRFLLGGVTFHSGTRQEVPCSPSPAPETRSNLP